MIRTLFIAFTLMFIVSCGGSDDDNKFEAGATDTELQGTWYGEERDTNVNTVIVMDGDTFTYESDPQYNDESFSGTFSITEHGDPRKMEFDVT